MFERPKRNSNWNKRKNTRIGVLFEPWTRVQCCQSRRLFKRTFDPDVGLFIAQKRSKTNIKSGIVGFPAQPKKVGFLTLVKSISSFSRGQGKWVDSWLKGYILVLSSVIKGDNSLQFNYFPGSSKRFMQAEAFFLIKISLDWCFSWFGK